LESGGTISVAGLTASDAATGDASATAAMIKGGRRSADGGAPEEGASMDDSSEVFAGAGDKLFEGVSALSIAEVTTAEVVVAAALKVPTTPSTACAPEFVRAWGSPIFSANDILAPTVVAGSLFPACGASIVMTGTSGSGVA